jgi:hypothetical protein
MMVMVMAKSSGQVSKSASVGAPLSTVRAIILVDRGSWLSSKDPRLQRTLELSRYGDS